MYKMKPRFALGAFTLVALAIGGVVAQDALKSGPETGKGIPGPFHPLNVNGASAGKKNCLV